MKIKPTQAGFPQREATDIEINTFFSVGGTTSQTHWTIKSEQGEILAQGNCSIPEEIHAQWGTDDSIIEDYVLEQLNLEKL